MSVASERPPAPKNTGLKILVSVLGAVLVLGFFGLVGTIVYQAAEKSSAAEEADGAGKALPAFGDITIPMRQGERIARIQPTGDRLFVELATTDGNSRLVVIEQATGRVLGSIAFAPQP
jgi:hypothetical protein